MKIIFNYSKKGDNRNRLSHDFEGSIFVCKFGIFEFYLMKFFLNSRKESRKIWMIEDARNIDFELEINKNHEKWIKFLVQVKIRKNCIKSLFLVKSEKFSKQIFHLELK